MTDSETTPAVAVEDLYAELSTGPLADLRVEMVHGQRSSEEKDAVMSRFAAGEVDVLVVDHGHRGGGRCPQRLGHGDP